MASIMPTLTEPAARPARGPYEVIAADLREQIQNGRLAVGDRVPTMAELATTHGVSIATSHRALALLRAEGLVQVSRGQRTVVIAVAESPSGREASSDGVSQS